MYVHRYLVTGNLGIKDKAVDFKVPRYDLPKSIEELEIMVMKKIEQWCGIDRRDHHWRLTSFVKSEVLPSFYPVNRRKSVNLEDLPSLSGLKFRDINYYTGFARGDFKKIDYARILPQNLEEALTHFSLYLPSGVRSCFLDPGNVDLSIAALEDAYKCPDCGFWIQGNLLVTELYEPVLSKRVKKAFCVSPECNALLDEQF